MAEGTSDDKTLNDIQVANLLNDQWKWRHQHCWRFLSRFGLTALTIALVPYLQRLDIIEKQLGDLIQRLGNWELFFPLASWAIAQAAVYLFAEEYVRCRPVETMCFRVLARQNNSPLPIPEVTPPARSWLGRIGQMLRSIGQTTIFGYSSFATIFTFFNAWMLLEMGILSIDRRWFFGVGIVLSLIFIVFAVLLSIRAGEKIKDILKKQESEEKKITNLTSLEPAIPNTISPTLPPVPVSADSDSRAEKVLIPHSRS